MFSVIFQGPFFDYQNGKIAENYNPEQNFSDVSYWKRLGRTGVNIATRLMGLVLVAIAVEFIAAGIRELFPALA